MVKRSTEKCYFIKNDKNYSNLIELWFDIDPSDDFIAIRKILPMLLLNTSKRYSSEQQMEREYMRNYIINASSGIIEVGEKKFYTFQLKIPQKKRVKDFDIKKALSFFLDSIYFPQINDNEFVKFNEKKEQLQREIQHIYKSKYKLSWEELYQELDEDGTLTDTLFHHQEQLEYLNNQDTYHYYYKMIHSHKPFIFLYGNEELKEAEVYLNNFYKDYEPRIVSLERRMHFLTLNKEIKIIETEKPYNESLLYMVYKVENMKDDDRILVKTISSILGSNVTKILFNKLRIKEKLVYWTNSEAFSTYGMFIIVAGIDKNNKQLAIEKVKELFCEINKIEVIDDALKQLRENGECFFIRSLDSFYYEYNKRVTKYFGILETQEEQFNQAKQVTAEQVLDFLSRIKLDTIDFVKGVEDAK